MIRKRMPNHALFPQLEKMGWHLSIEHAILMAINSLSTQLEREIQVEDMEKELETLRAKQLEQLKVKATATNDDEDDA